MQQLQALEIWARSRDLATGRNRVDSGLSALGTSLARSKRRHGGGKLPLVINSFGHAFVLVGRA